MFLLLLIIDYIAAIFIIREREMFMKFFPVPYPGNCTCICTVVIVKSTCTYTSTLHVVACTCLFIVSILKF